MTDKDIEEHNKNQIESEDRRSSFHLGLLIGIIVGICIGSIIEFILMVIYV